MHIDAVVVPRGAEARAVKLGWQPPLPSFICVPAGVAAASVLTDCTGIESALVIGLCGALDPMLRVGDAVVYERVTDGMHTFDLDPALTAACARACKSTPRIALAVARVVGSVAAKKNLRETTHAAAIDMEAATLLHTLTARGVRVAMVRVVSDDALGELPDLADVYDARGTIRPLSLALAFARTPRKSVRFIANVVRALRALRATANRLSC